MPRSLGLRLVLRRIFALGGAAAPALVLSLVALASGSAPVPAHDFDRQTLAAYLSLRFSSAVPPAVIQHVLATEGFAARDVALAGQVAPQRTSGESVSATGGAAGRAAGAAPYPVNALRQVSRDRLRCPKSDSTECELDTEAEPDIAINPAEPRNLAGAFQQGRFPNGGAVDVGWTASFDGGRTWRFGGSAPGLTVGVSDAPTQGPGPPFERASDPVVSFDRKHDRLYLNSLSVSNPGCAQFCDTALTLNISRNGGRSFGDPVVAHENVSDPDASTFRFNDKNWIVTDNNPHSPYYGRTYVTWDQVRCADPTCTTLSQPVMVRYSDNGGKTWSKAIQATSEEPAQTHAEIGVQPVPLPNGDLVIVYADVAAGVYTFTGNYAAILSKDGGKTWSQPHVIDAANPYAEESGSVRAPNIPSATASGKTLYVAFQDQRFTPGRNDILLTRSSDEGLTWSDAINATPDESDLDHFTPDIAAAGKIVHLTYRARQPGNLDASPMVDAVYRRIADRGRKPRKPLELGKPSNADVAAFVTVEGAPFKFFGDYAGIVAAPGGLAHPIWDHAQTFKNQRDNPTDTHQRSFSARVG